MNCRDFLFYTLTLSFTQFIESLYLRYSNRRVAGVVDRGRLEICCTLRGTGGSNPSLSAFKRKREVFSEPPSSITPKINP